MKQIIKNQQIEEKRDRRFSKGMVVAISCEIVAIDDDQQQKGTYKVQSETDVNKYYTVKFMNGTPIYCNCKDFEMQSQKNRNHICKHQRGIVLAENYGLVVVVGTKQQNSKSQNMEPSYSTTLTTSSSNIKKQESTSFKDDDYTF